MSQLGLSLELGQFIEAPFFCQKSAQKEDSSLTALRTEAFEIIKMGLTDTVATMFAGKNEEVAKILLQLFNEEALPQGTKNTATHSIYAPSPVFQREFKIAHAAFLNATLGHALDYDDVALSGHPSVVLGPAVFAVAHGLNASGEKALEAYWVGYEVWAELLSREQDQYHLKGWHPTAILGTIACAAAVSYLHGLDAKTSTHALSLAATMAAGLTANFGSMSKPMQAGRAVSNAIEAVNYAKNGMRASSAVFESKAGFLNAISPKGRVDLDSPAKCLHSAKILETRLSIKQYPLCYSAHRVIDGVLDAKQSYGLAHSDVERVKAWIGPAQASMLRNRLPQSALEAKFSLEFSVASALIAGRVGLAQLDDAFVLMHETQKTMKLVDVEVVDTKCPIDPAFSIHDRVEIHLRNGSVIDSGDIRFCRGNAFLPLKAEALKQKFLDCFEYAQVSNKNFALGLYDQLSELEKLKSIRTLFST